MGTIIVQGRKDKYGYFLMFPKQQCLDSYKDLQIECWIPYEGHGLASKEYLVSCTKPTSIEHVTSLISAYESEYHCKLVYDSNAMRKLKEYKA